MKNDNLQSTITFGWQHSATSWSSPTDYTIGTVVRPGIFVVDLRWGLIDLEVGWKLMNVCVCPCLYIYIYQPYSIIWDCWWFRNPFPNHLECIKSCKYGGFLPSTVCVCIYIYKCFVYDNPQIDWLVITFCLLWSEASCFESCCNTIYSRLDRDNVYAVFRVCDALCASCFKQFFEPSAVSSVEFGCCNVFLEFRVNIISAFGLEVDGASTFSLLK